MSLSLVHEELNQARINQKQAAQSLSLEARTKLFDGLKGNKYTLLKSEERLSQPQIERLQKLKLASPVVGIMHSLKEEFHQLFEKTYKLGQGIIELINWLRKAEPYYQKTVKTIGRPLAEVAGYFEQRTTNGVVEGINNKLKLLKRCGFGLRSFHNFQARALLFWHFPNILAH